MRRWRSFARSSPPPTAQFERGGAVDGRLSSLGPRAVSEEPAGAPHVAGAAHEENPGANRDLSGRPAVFNDPRSPRRRTPRSEPRTDSLTRPTDDPQSNAMADPAGTRLGFRAGEGPRRGRRDPRPDARAGARPDAARLASSGLAPAQSRVSRRIVAPLQMATNRRVGGERSSSVWWAVVAGGGGLPDLPAQVVRTATGTASVNCCLTSARNWITWPARPGRSGSMRSGCRRSTSR